MEVKLLRSGKMAVSNGDGQLLKSNDLDEVVEYVLEEFPEEAECHILEFQSKGACQNGICLVDFDEEKELKFNRRLVNTFYRDNSPLTDELVEEF